LTFTQGKWSAGACRNLKWCLPDAHTWYAF
jgi:hypothetical protein